jgi:DGQHR domain-containing protein
MTATLSPKSAGKNDPTPVKVRMQILEAGNGAAGDGTSAVALMNPEAMKQLFFVSSHSVADPDSPGRNFHGYQRDPMPERIRALAAYFRKPEARITPPIVSVRISDPSDRREFVRLFNSGRIDEIHRRWSKAVVSVIDGQHRFRGLVEAQSQDPSFDPMAPVLFFFGQTYIEEALLFDTINSTQRKLPKALIEFTKTDIIHAGEENHAQVIREIAFALSLEKDSVWYNQINMTGARNPDKSITFEGLRRSMSNMLPDELIKRLVRKGLDPVVVAKQYWALVASACQTAWNEVPNQVYDPETQTMREVPVTYRLKDLVGVASVSRLGRDILTSALEAQDFEDRMVELVSKLSEVDWIKDDRNPWMRSQAGFAGQKVLYEVLHGLVYLDQYPGESNHSD